MRAAIRDGARCVMVGLGGIWVEALGDVRLMAPDLTEDEIVDELGKLKTAKLLQGFRGSPPADIKAVAAAAAALGRLMRPGRTSSRSTSIR